MADPSPRHGRISDWASCLLVGLLLLLPLYQPKPMQWHSYARLWLITAGLGYVLWRQIWRHRTSAQPSAGPVMALGFIFLIQQFGGTTPQELSYWPVLVVSLCAFVARILGGRGGRLDRMDWAFLAACGLLTGILVASVAVPSLDGREVVAWTVLPRVIASSLVWFVVRRCATGPPACARALGAGLVGVLALVSAVGLVQVACVPYQWARGNGARAAGDTAAAVQRFEEGLAVARRLGLQDLADGLAFRLASVHHARGEEDQAAAALGLGPGFVQVVPGDAWEGPEGGNLYYLISCWKDLSLYPGEVEIRIHASGTSANGDWPCMRVKLDGQALGDVYVTSTEPKPYPLVVHVDRRSRRRLEITFLNDFFQPDPYIDRNLRVDRAEIQYRRVQWLGEPARRFTDPATQRRPLRLPCGQTAPFIAAMASPAGVSSGWCAGRARRRRCRCWPGSGGVRAPRRGAGRVAAGRSACARLPSCAASLTAPLSDLRAAAEAGWRNSWRRRLPVVLALVAPAALWAQGTAGMSGADAAARVMAAADVVYETSVQMPCTRVTWEALLEAPEVAGALWNAYGYGPAYEVSRDRGDTVHVRDPTGLQGDVVLVEHGADLRRYLVYGRVDHWAVPFLNEGLAVFSLRNQAAPDGQVAATLTVHVKAHSVVAGYLLSLGAPLLRRHVANRIELNLRDAQQLVAAVERRPEEVRQRAGEAVAAQLRVALGH